MTNKNKISPDFIGDNPEEMEEGTICPLEEFKFEGKKYKVENHKAIEMKEEFKTLSDKIIKEKIWDSKGKYPIVDFIFIDDVKEFIRRLKEEIEWTQTKGQKLGMITEEEIDKLAGEKLIGGEK